MIDPVKLDKIRKKCEDASQNYAGIREHDYARDVAALLRHTDDLEKSIKLLAGDQDDVVSKLQQQVEIADLWKRDCEAAQVRVRELEAGQTLIVKLDEQQVNEILADAWKESKRTLTITNNTKQPATVLVTGDGLTPLIDAVIDATDKDDYDDQPVTPLVTQKMPEVE